MIAAPGTGSFRHDLTVILARGASRRMGRPKGLLSLPGGDQPLVRIIADLYRGRAPVVVVTLEILAEEYRRALEGMAQVTVLGHPSGGETALSVWEGWHGFKAREPVSHVWAHPVDMPQVAPGTLDRLLALSTERPEALVRPEFGGQPGHPVVIPVSWLRGLAPGSRALSGPFRDVIAGQQAAEGSLPVMTCRCDDPGTVRDFDSPRDLDPRWEGNEDDVQG